MIINGWNFTQRVHKSINLVLTGFTEVDAAAVQPNSKSHNRASQ